MSAHPTGPTTLGGSRGLVGASIVATALYVGVAMVMASHVTFYWDDYFVLLTLDDRGLGGALVTGINGNWWPLATVLVPAQLAVFGDWYPGYVGVNAALVAGSAWAAWFAFAPLARPRPWLLWAALVGYVCSVGLVVNTTVMTASWPLAAALAMLAAALATRGAPAWAWAGVLALCGLAESGLFAVFATTVGAALVVARMQSRAGRGPARRDVRIALALVLVGVLGTLVGYVVASTDPIDYYTHTAGDAVTAVPPVDALFGAQPVRAVLTLLPAWLAAPLALPMLVWPAALPWLVVQISAHLAAVVVGVIAVLAGALIVSWRRSRAGARPPTNLVAALILVVPVLEAAALLGGVRPGLETEPRYAIIWLLPIAVAWALILQGRPTRTWLRAGRTVAGALLAATGVACLLVLPWTYRMAFDVDNARWDNSADQISQFDRCRAGEPATANQQVAPGLRDDLLCQVVAVLDR